MSQTIQTVTRCRCGMCTNLTLPAMRECAACRRVRIASERQRRAAVLAKAAQCQVASEINRRAAP